jgi:hypothetical protein
VQLLVGESRQCGRRRAFAKPLHDVLTMHSLTFQINIVSV